MAVRPAPLIVASYALSSPDPATSLMSETTTVHFLPSFLSATDVSQIKEASTGGLRPQLAGRSVCEALRGVSHDVAYSSEHVALFLHREGLLALKCPVLCNKILSTMRSQGGNSALQVRCIELHTYAVGGGLLDPGHCDDGSTLTISVLLSEAETFDGGEFVTWNKGHPVAHSMQQGDAILFYSERVHNVTTITRGVRQSLVVEMWEQNANSKDRHG